VWHTLRFSVLLPVELSRARIFQFMSKLTEARQWVVHVAPSQGSRKDEVEDGRIDATDCVRLCYTYFVVFIVLGHRVILVF
jgi:hypothetical protein